MKRISKARRRYLIQCAVAMQPWRIDNEEEAHRLADAAIRDLSVCRMVIEEAGT